MTTIPEARWAWPLSGVLCFLLAMAFAFSVALTPIRADNDCWWHVKSGQYLWENGLPKHDVFSFMAAEYEWHNHEWLAQLAYYAAYALGEASGLGNWRGVILFNATLIALSVAMVFWLSRKISGSFLVALAISVATVAIGRRMFYQRPPVMTNVLLMAELIILVGVREGWFSRRWLWALPVMFAAWTNIHGGWLAGGVVFGAWLVDALLGMFGGRARGEKEPVWSLGFLAALGFAALGSTLLNPYGWRLYELASRVMGDKELVMSIGELQPPNLFFVVDFQTILIVLFLAALVANKFPPRLWEVLVFAFFLHQAMQHVRHLSLFSVLMVPVAARVLGGALLWAEERIARPWPNVALASVALYLLAWVLVNPREGGQWTNPFTSRSYPGRNVAWLRGEAYVRNAFPADVCDFVELTKPVGRMFNGNTYAGYLIWRFSPEPYQVFSDPRFDIFGGDIWRVENTIMSGDPRVAEGSTRPIWRELLDQYDIEWMIIRGTSGIAARLRESGSEDWALAAEWPASDWEVWLRRTPENAPALAGAKSIAPLTGGVAP